MSAPVQIRLYEGEKNVFSGEFEGPVELGREKPGEQGPFFQKFDSGVCRIVIARADEHNVSRKHTVIEPTPGGAVRLTNFSTSLPIRFPDGTQLQSGTSSERALPVVFILGNKTVRVESREATSDIPLRALAEATMAPGQILGDPLRRAHEAPPADTRESKALVRWLQAAMEVLQSATSSADFFEKAVRVAVELLSLDSCRVLLLDGDAWRAEAVQTSSRFPTEPPRPGGPVIEGPRLRPGQTPGKPSLRVLNRVRQEKRTFWESPQAVGPTVVSLAGVQAVVAAPILDGRGVVIGALYGERLQGASLAVQGPFTELEAMLVELLARGVATGLSRLEQEQATLAARVRFEQFFTPTLAHQLEIQPDLLNGRDVEVSILFCDIRGFSRISERLGCAATMEWIGQVMQTLSGCVLAHSGVLVDYIGDELMAMWGAPVAQPDHAVQACRAALDMLDRLPELNARWQTVLQEPMDIGIGVNTGVARVGNTGSAYKFKYGPLGPTVNLASRVQGATKHMHCQLLVTGSTRARLDDSFLIRRLGTVKVVNIAESVDLYELGGRNQTDWAEAKQAYEKALDLFERQMPREAGLVLGQRRIQAPTDGPALILLYRAIKCMVEKRFEPIWVLTDK
jgi:adenylate cyclase